MKVLAKKMMVIGLDAPIAPRVYQYTRKGYLPTINKLIEEGVYALNCMIPFPTITPPNWTTVATGAWPGTHGITCFNVHISGDPLDVTHHGFFVKDRQAETIWEAAEKVGKKSIIVNYPGTWPPESNLKKGYQLGGGGLSIDSYRLYEGHPMNYKCSLADDQLFSIKEYPLSNKVEFEKCSGWKNLQDPIKGMTVELFLRYTRAKASVKEKTWYALVTSPKDNESAEVTLCTSKDITSAFTKLKVGEWSPIIRQDFDTEEGPRKGAFRCKLIECSIENNKFRLYVTSICDLAGWSFPKDLAKEISSKEGLPLPRGGFNAFTLGWIDIDTLTESIQYQNIWLADACTYLLENKEWDLFFMHAHCPDWAYHTFSNKLDPSINPNKEEVAKYEELELKMYQSLDNMIGKIISKVNDETLIIVVSDHGAKATTHHFDPVKLLVNAGLMVIKESEKGKKLIDWERTKAIVQRSCYIYINLKGRDPQGIVKSGKEYEDLQEEIIRLLYDYTDDKTGKKPIALALKKEDARIIGLYGDRIGDIVFAISPKFGAQHGPHLPTAKYGIGSLQGLLIMKGPGVKKNYLMKRTAWLTDIVPTICYLTELPLPKNTEGAILYQAFQDPNFKLKEIRDLRENYEKIKAVYESEQSLTHSYNM